MDYSTGCVAKEGMEAGRELGREEASGDVTDCLSQCVCQSVITLIHGYGMCAPGLNDVECWMDVCTCGVHYSLILLNIH